MNVAEYTARFLVEKKVGHVFGFQGSAILELLHAMIDTKRIEYIQNYHEQASSFCADAYARVTGNIGVAIATSGPGAINLISGIVNAYFDSIPCLFFTGQDYLKNINKPDNVRQNGFQGLDIVSMVRPVTKYAETIKDEKNIRYELEKAYYLATSGRPGSVLLDIPIDIQFKEVNVSELQGFDAPQEESFELGKVDEFISMLRKAKRPVILAGGGIRIAGVEDMFNQFADLVRIPVVTTLNGRDAYSNAFGFSGLYGNSHSNLAILNSDLLIVLGSRLGQQQVGKDRNKYTKAKIVHVDVDKGELNRVLDEELSIHCDLRTFLGNLLRELSNTDLPDFQSWYKQVELWAEKYSKNAHVNKDKLDPVEFVELITTFFDDHAIMTADIGQNQMWVAQGVKMRNSQRLLMSSGLGPLGYSLPAAIGAKVAKPNNQVIAFTGDGGLQMNIQELLLVGQKQLDIKIIVFNNNTLGLVRENQERWGYSQYYGTNPKDFVCADLQMVAKTYGLKYIEIRSLNGVRKIGQALADKVPYLIDVKISYGSKCMNRYDDFENIKSDLVV
jgi:acetolactate synthase-1/2/3 large subunit